MSVTRYFYEKLSTGDMGDRVDIGAKASNVTVTVDTTTSNAQTEFENLWAEDADLSDRINQEVTDRKKAVSDEADARAAADATLQTNINTEINNRKQAITDEEEARDNAIANAIATEVENRNSAINSAIETLDESLSEVIAGVSTLANNNKTNIETNTTAIATNK